MADIDAIHDASDTGGLGRIVRLEVDAVEPGVRDMATSDGHFAANRGDPIARRALDVRVVDDDTGRWEIHSRIVSDTDAITARVAGDRIVEGDVGSAVDRDAVLPFRRTGTPDVTRTVDLRIVEDDVRRRRTRKMPWASSLLPWIRAPRKSTVRLLAVNHSWLTL